MTRLRRRVIPPDVFADPYLSPTDKRLFVIGMQLAAEDSGCLVWDAKTLRANILVHDDVPLERVEELMREVVSQGRVWLYEREGRTYGYISDFRVWQAKKGWFNAPEEVPLPPGITITEYESKNNAGRVNYQWPATREEFEPDVQPSERTKPTNELNLPKRTNELNGGASDELTRSGHLVGAIPGDDEVWS